MRGKEESEAARKGWAQSVIGFGICARRGSIRRRERKRRHFCAGAFAVVAGVLLMRVRPQRSRISDSREEIASVSCPRLGFCFH